MATNDERPTSAESRALPPLFWSDSRRRPTWKKVLLLGGAAVFLALGVIGWLIPVVTGIPFYIIGFAMLGAGSRRATALLNRLEERLPHRWRVGLRRMVERVQERRQSSRRARSDSIVSASTVSKGAGDQRSSERALAESKQK